MNNFYSGDYKKYMSVPAILFILFLAVIFFYPGVKQGIDLKGGTNIIVRADKPLDSKLLEPVLKQKFPLTELQTGSISSPAGYGIFIQYAENADIAGAKALIVEAKKSAQNNPSKAKSLVEESILLSKKYAGDFFYDSGSVSAEQAIAAAESALASAEKEFDIELQGTITKTYSLGSDIKLQKTQIGPSLGQTFYNLSIQALVLGIILLSVVIFIYFREILTSITVVAASLFNIVGAVAIMSLFGIPVSLTTIPALLMVIGYSVDTEIVMSARVLKRRENTPKERMNDSIGTILTMSFTAIAAVGTMMVFSHFAQITVIFEISAVLFFGLAADLVSSCMLNAPLILQHAETEEGSR